MGVVSGLVLCVAANQSANRRLHSLAHGRILAWVLGGIQITYVNSRLGQG